MVVSPYVDSDFALLSLPTRKKRRQDALALQSLAAQVGAHAAPQARQRLAELHDAAELLLLAHGAEARVVEVLGAALLVDPHGLQRC